MKIAEAIKHTEESLARYKKLNAEGRGKKMDEKIALSESHLEQLNEMAMGGKSPWHDYSDIIAIWGIEDFQPKITG